MYIFLILLSTHFNRMNSSDSDDMGIERGNKRRYEGEDLVENRSVSKRNRWISQNILVGDDFLNIPQSCCVTIFIGIDETILLPHVNRINSSDSDEKERERGKKRRHEEEDLVENRSISKTNRWIYQNILLGDDFLNIPQSCCVTIFAGIDETHILNNRLFLQTGTECFVPSNAYKQTLLIFQYRGDNFKSYSVVRNLPWFYTLTPMIFLPPTKNNSGIIQKCTTLGR